MVYTGTLTHRVTLGPFLDDQVEVASCAFVCRDMNNQGYWSVIPSTDTVPSLATAVTRPWSARKTLATSSVSLT